MAETHKVLIAVALGLGCLGIFLYEMIKRLETQVTIEKLVALGIGIVYCVVLCVVGQLAAFPAIFFVLAAVGLIWFGDELGSMTGMSMRGGTINKASPGFLVRIFGWLFLMSPVALAFYLYVIMEVQ